MKLRIAKLKSANEVVYETIENVQVVSVDLDENELLMTNFFVIDNKTNEIKVIHTDKITIT